MEKKRFIFDLDKTLLTCDYDYAGAKLFNEIFKEEAYKVIYGIDRYLDEYERENKKFSQDKLSEFLTMKSSLEITPDMIDEWIEIMAEIPDVLEDGVMKVLEHLKGKDKSLAVLTNWFSKSQISRLKRAGIYEYFDDVFTGDYQLKPHHEAYMAAVGDYNLEEAVIIGDNVYKDYIVPRSFGLDSILYDRDNSHSEAILKVKKMKELTKKY